MSSRQSTGAGIVFVMCVSASRGVPVVEVTPQQVKGVTGLGGRCEKKDVVKMMGRLLTHKQQLNNHVADAAASAIVGCLST